MGLDINRADFLATVNKAATFVHGQNMAAVIFEP
jgi:hypothetical protein